MSAKDQTQVRLGREALASVVVFLVALPLCMGIAIASGLPPAAGLITGIVGGILVGSLSGAPLQVSGPAAGLTVIVWNIMQQHGIVGLGAVVLIAGALQLLAGVLKLGMIFRAVSPAVIHGMLGGIGVLIFASQFHVMLDDVPKGSGIENLLSIPEAVRKGVFPIAGSTHHQAALIGVVTISSILAWLRFAPKRLAIVPAPLVAVVVGVAVAALGSFPVRLVEVPADLTSAITWIGPGSFAALPLRELVLEAFALAVIASAETLLCATAIDQKHDGARADYDKELRAQGIGNIICGAVGALPMTGVIVRSSANVDAGAKTRLSAILHGVWILALVVLMPALLATIPVATLAALLVYTGYKLVNPGQIKLLWSSRRGELVVYAVTLTMIVATDLLTGVLAGIAAASLRLVYKFSQLDVTVEPRAAQGAFDLYIRGSATFLRLPKLANALATMPPASELHVHLDDVTYMDHAVIDELGNWERLATRAGGKLVVEWDAVQGLYAGVRIKRPTTRKPGALAASRDEGPVRAV
jgi:MFS superfamily sulfate permease-like transporter